MVSTAGKDMREAVYPEFTDRAGDTGRRRQVRETNLKVDEQRLLFQSDKMEVAVLP